MKYPMAFAMAFENFIGLYFFFEVWEVFHPHD